MDDDILEDNYLPIKKYATKAFVAVSITLVLLLLLYTLSTLMMGNYFYIPFYSEIAQVLSILAIASNLFGLFSTIKAIINKEKNDFTKIVAIIGNSFFFLILLIGIWMFLSFDLF